MKATVNVTLSCPSCGGEFDVVAHVDHDPGMYTLPNGDPGYPESTDCWLEPDPENCTHCGYAFNDNDMKDFLEQAVTSVPQYDPQWDGPDGPDEDY